MPIVFDNHTRGNNDNNGHQLRLLQQQQQQQQQQQHTTTDTINPDASSFEKKARRILSPSTLQHPLKTTTPIAQDKEQNSRHQRHSLLQPFLLSSGNDSLLSLSSLPEMTETETRQSATTASAVATTTSSPCLMTAKLNTVAIPSDQSVQEQVSWAASQPDHRQRHHRLRQQEQQQQQNSNREAYTLSPQERLWQRGDYNGIDNNNNNAGAQQQHEQEQQMEGEEILIDRDDSCHLNVTTECRRRLDRETPSSSLSSSSCSPSRSPSPPPSSLLPFSCPSLPSLADNLMLQKQFFPLQSSLPSTLSSTSFAHSCSPLSPPDSATSSIPLSALYPSRSNNSLTADVDLDLACVINRGNVALDTSNTNKSGSSVAAAASMASSENSIPDKEESSLGGPGQSDPVVVSCSTSPSSQATARSPPSSPSSWMHSLTHQPPLDSSSSSPCLLAAAVAVSSSNERRGNDSAGPEQVRTKRRRSMDDSDASDQENEENEEEDSDVLIRPPSPSLPLSPSHSPIELDYSFPSLSKGLAVNSELLTATETMNLNSTMDDSQMILITAGTTAAAVETKSSPGSEKRRRKRVTEGHNTNATTSPPAKTAKKVNTSAAVPNNSVDRYDVSTYASTARPTCSYTTMIMEVFQASHKTKMDLPDIYGGVMAMYPYYRKANKVWQSSVRHALSQSKFFCKMERGPNEPGKGSLWTVDTQNTLTPNPPRKRKAFAGNSDYQSATACPAQSKGKHSTAPTPKLACTTMGESLKDENLRGFHSSPAASIPSPAASDDTDDANAVRRSGRARRPPRTKEADDYVTNTTAIVSSHSRKPSLVMGAPLSTPPSSPAPQDHHHPETAPLSLAPSLARKRSSSIRSDKSLTSPAAVSHTNHHFTIDLPGFDRKMSTTTTSVVASSATTTLPRRTLLNMDQDLANIPGVVTSSRIRRPPQKLAEFVSSEDFKAAPCGKRPAPPTSLGSASSSSSFLSGNTDRAHASNLTSTSTPIGTGAGAGIGAGMGVTERRVERRGRKRARPDVVGAQSSPSSSQHLYTASPRRDRKVTAVDNRAKDVDVMYPIGPKGTTTLPVAMPAQSPIGAVGIGAPAFISLKDLELSHAASLDDNDDEEDEDEEEEDYFGVQGRRNYKSSSSSSSRRYGSSGRQSQHETYEQRRQAGIQQIVVASLDWYEESDSEDEVNIDVDVEGEGDYDTDMVSSSHTSSHDINNYSAAVGAHGGGVRSGFDSGFDSGSDSSQGFARQGGWMMTETETAATTATIATEFAGGVLEDIVGATAATEAFETVCILAPEVEDEGVMDSSTTLGDARIDATAVPSHFLQPARVPSGGASLTELDGVHVHGSQASPSVITTVDTSPLLLPITIDTSSSTPNLRTAVSDMSGVISAAGTGAAGTGGTGGTAGMPMIPGGILKEIVAATTAALEANGSVSAPAAGIARSMDKSSTGGLIAEPMEVELEEDDASVRIGSLMASGLAASAVTAESKVDNYMGWLNL